MLANVLMSVSDREKDFGVPSRAVMRVGAGNFEGLEDYKALGYSPITWIDCHPATNVDHTIRLINTTCT